jgi:hypothetical protein
MGSGESKAEQVKVEDNSDSFHVLELHMPTLGVGVFCLIILIIVAVVVWCLRKKKARRQLRNLRANPSNLSTNTHSISMPNMPTASQPSYQPAALPSPYGYPNATLNNQYPLSPALPQTFNPSAPRDSAINLTLDPQTIRDFFRPERRPIMQKERPKPQPEDDEYPYK